MKKLNSVEIDGFQVIIELLEPGNIIFEDVEKPVKKNVKIR